MYFGFLLILLGMSLRKGGEAIRDGNDPSKRLFEKLLSNYNKLVRPVRNSTEVLQIQFKFKLSQILDVHEKNQIVTLSGWLIHAWKDYKLTWNPREFGGVTMMHIPAELIWLPDIILYNNADGSPQVTKLTKANVNYNGSVDWSPPVIYNSMCRIQIEWFPFDGQFCDLKFGSWTYYGSEVDMIHLITDQVQVTYNEHNEREWVVERGIDITEYQESGEWDLMSVLGVRHSKRYPCCTYPFVDITYSIDIRRKTLFYTISLVTPCVGITLLTCFVFYLPSASNNKVTLCVSLLVSLTVFFLLLVEIIPPTSLAIPLIARYLIFTMACASISIVFTVLTLNIHYRSGVKPMPRWIRRTFLDTLPKYLFFTTCRVEKEIPVPQSLIEFAMSMTAPLVPSHHFLAGHHKPLSSGFKRFSSESKGSVGGAPGPGRSLGGGGERKELSEEAKKVFKFLQATIKKTCLNICYIGQNLREKHEEGKIKQDWKFFAMVIDRILLITFSASILIGTAVMFTSAPALHDHRTPITVIVQEEIEAMKLTFLRGQPQNPV